MPAAAEDPIPLTSRRSFLRAAHRVVDGSRRVILRAAARGFTTRAKPDKSFVTDADLAAEKVLRAAIARRFPDHGILGEEFERVRPEAEFQWIIDPIDGTLSFTRGIPLYGTILALHRRGKPVLGIIDHPALGLRYAAAAGLGARRNGKPLRLRDDGTPAAGEIIATGDRMHFLKVGSGPAFDRLLKGHPQVRTYADCFGHALAAEGAVGAMVDYGIRIWDMAATQVIIEEAGGKFELVSRLPDGKGGHFYNIVCGKPRVVKRLRRLLAT